MIKESMQQIIGRLNDYLNSQFSNGATFQYVVLSHLSEGNESIHVNLVNVEEDKVFKNSMNPPVNNTQGTVNALGGIPVMRLNLYLLFAFNPGDSNQLYEKALSLLNAVLRFFHTHKRQEIEVIIDGQQHVCHAKINYHNVSLEDSNNMWSNLGGTQKPYAMYKLQLLEILPVELPPQVVKLTQPVVEALDR
ncbi:MAG: Pvc16 family protein [Cyclobacteriaceae bacterium]